MLTRCKNCVTQQLTTSDLFDCQTGLTPLHVAAFIGNENVVSYLLDKGANISSVTQRGETPLHYAARAGHPNIMRLLLDNGAQLDAKSKA